MVKLLQLSVVAILVAVVTTESHSGIKARVNPSKPSEVKRIPQSSSVGVQERVILFLVRSCGVGMVNLLQPLVAGLNNGNEVVPFATRGKWFYVRVVSGPNRRVNGLEGWVNSDYLYCH